MIFSNETVFPEIGHTSFRDLGLWDYYNPPLLFPTDKFQEENFQNKMNFTEKN